MPTDAEFLATICAHPDDMGPRLVYADWLEEQGECDRAEFIRLQILEPHDDKSRERQLLLLICHSPDWLPKWLQQHIVKSTSEHVSYRDRYVHLIRRSSTITAQISDSSPATLQIRRGDKLMYQYELLPLANFESRPCELKCGDVVSLQPVDGEPVEIIVGKTNSLAYLDLADNMKHEWRRGFIEYVELSWGMWAGSPQVIAPVMDRTNFVSESENLTFSQRIVQERTPGFHEEILASTPIREVTFTTLPLFSHRESLSKRWPGIKFNLPATPRGFDPRLTPVNLETRRLNALLRITDELINDGRIMPAESNSIRRRLVDGRLVEVTE